MKPWISRYLIALLVATSTLHAADDEQAPADGESAEQSTPMIRKSNLPRPDANPDAVRTAELAKAYNPSTEVIWLEAGPEKALALYQPHNTSKLLGNVVLFHDESTSADWPDLVRVLRIGLPDKGWATLSVQLPTPPERELPERKLTSPRAYLPPGGIAAVPVENLEEGEAEEGSEETTEETAAEEPTEETSAESSETEQPTEVADETATEDSEPPLPPYDARIMNYGDAALQHTQENEGQQVILGIGTGGAWAASLAKEQQDAGREVVLVLVDARQPSTETSPNLEAILPQLTGTVLDLYHSDPLTLVPLSSQARARVNLAKRSNLENYHHNRLPSMAGDRKKHNDWVLTRVRGFMNTHLIKPLEEDQQQDDKPMMRPPTPRGEQAPGRTS